MPAACRCPAAASPWAAAGSGSSGSSIYLLITVLSNGSGGLSAPLQNLNDRSVGAQPTAGCTTARAAQHARGLPDRRLREQHPGVLVEPVPPERPQLRDREDRLLRRLDARPAAARRPRTSARSTARSTSTSTSTSASSTSCGRASARTGGPFAQAYVLAHEYGHHVQDQLGVLGNGSGQAGAHGRAPCAPSCRPTASRASGRTTRPRPAISTDLTQADIADGLNAAAAVGDDRIQQETQGRIDRDTWTHGSASAAPALVHGRLRRAASRAPATRAGTSSSRPSRASGTARRRGLRSRGSGGSAARSSGRRPCGRADARRSVASTSRARAVSSGRAAS